MKTQYTPRQCLHWLLATCCALVFCLATAQAQSTGTGTITGHVYNPGTGEYLRNADVHIAGTNRATTTANDGSFEFTNVPAGPVTIQVSFTGYETASVNLNVTAGSTATADVNLTSSLKSDEGPIKMDAYTVSTEREGNAKAIMDQKQAMTIDNVVAAETFGNTAEGNVGEFLKFLPGIQLDYVEADARNPRIRGLPAQYTMVTYEGMDLASADGFIQNNGTDNGGGAGAGGRSFGFEQVSMSSVDSVDVSFTTDASQSAGSAAGNIDLRANHAFQRNGRRIAFDISAMANSEELYWRKLVRPDDRHHRLISPNFSFEYSDLFLDRKLGVFIGVNETNFFNEQRQLQAAYDANPTATDPRPLVMTQIRFKDGPKFTEKSTLNFTVDYRVNPDVLVSLVGSLNNFGMMTSNRNFGINSTRANIKGNGFTEWDGTQLTGTNITNSWSYLAKRTHGFSYVPTATYKWNNVTLRGALAYSVSENNYAGGASNRLPGNTLAGVNLPTTGITVNAWRPADDLYAWRVVQLTGPDWGDIANYKASATGYPTFGWDGRYNRVTKYQARLDAKYATAFSLPTFFKVGGNVESVTYQFENPTSWNTWNYIGPGGGQGGSFALYPSQAVFSQGHGGFFLSQNGRTPAIPDHNTFGELWMTHPEYFAHNESPSNFLTMLNNSRYIREQMDAAYAMMDMKPIRPIEFQVGVRWERTRDETKGYQVRPASEVKAAGYTVNEGTAAASGIPPQIANTIPGIDYQYRSLPRSALSNRYDKLFPSAGFKYKFSSNLQLLIGYSYTLTRPAYGDLSGTFSENDITEEISAPNTHLKPEYSNNYTARLMYYFEPVGSFGVSVFQNDIKGYIQSVRIPGAAADFGYTDPQYATYTVITKNNLAGKTTYRGATLEYQQSLSFLPKPFNGFNVFANYTRLYTQVQVPDPSLLHASGSPYNYGWIPGISPHTINAGVSYKYKRAFASVNAHWTADTPTTSTYNTWMNQNVKYDINLSYNVARHWTVYFKSRNITNVPDRTYVGNNRQQIGGGRGYEYYGAYLYLGAKATF